MKWRAYLPAVWMLLLAWLFFSYPWMASIIVGGSLIFGAVLYAAVVRNFRRVHQAMGQKAASEQGAEPTFRNVTIHMVRKGRWFESQ